MDVEFMPGTSFPRTSSTPGEIGVVELGYKTVIGFSQIDSAPGECGAVELDFRRARVARKTVLVGWIVSVHVNGDWVTPLRISPQTCMELSLLGGSLSSVD